MTAACPTMTEREAHVQQIAGAMMCHGWAAERCLADARRAVELAERVGMGADAVMWLAARGEPIPQDEPRMREAMREKRARDVFAMLGVAFPWM